MTRYLQDKPLIWNTSNSNAAEAYFLVLYNDDFNTFDYVIESLMEICDHTSEQAEQCATITHYKGRCDVKKGLKKDLIPMQVALIKRNLKALIE
jgi:ATP-dependent Clp protease adaptor protein ClpS